MPVDKDGNCTVRSFFCHAFVNLVSFILLSRVYVVGIMISYQVLVDCEHRLLAVKIQCVALATEIRDTKAMPTLDKKPRSKSSKYAITTHTKLSPQDKIKEIVASATIYVIGRLPLTISRSLGAALGWVNWRYKLKPFKVTEENLEISFPNMLTDERAALAKLSVIETGKLAAEIFTVNTRKLSWLQSKIFKAHGEDIIHKAIEEKRGVILLAPHIGNWELLSVTLPTYAPLTALYRPPKQPYLDSIIKKAREKTGATLVPTTPKGVIKLIRSLKTGGITAVLPDQSPSEGSGIFVPFFNEPTYTMTLVHGLAKRSNAVIVFAFALRVKGGFHLYFTHAPKDIYSEDLATSVRALSKGVEDVIGYAPEQYQWEYKRFKHRPPGAKMIYL